MRDKDLYLYNYDSSGESYTVRIEEDKIRWDMYCTDVYFVDHHNDLCDVWNDQYELFDISCSILPRRKNGI